jgi:hypothetical protein
MVNRYPSSYFSVNLTTLCHLEILCSSFCLVEGVHGDKVSSQMSSFATLCWCGHAVCFDSLNRTFYSDEKSHIFGMEMVLTYFKLISHFSGGTKRNYLNPLIQWVPGAVSLGVKLTTHLHLVPRSKNVWNYTSTPPVRFHGVVLS